MMEQIIAIEKACNSALDEIHGQLEPDLTEVGKRLVEIRQTSRDMIRGRGEPDRASVKDKLQKAFPDDWKDIIWEMRWDHIMGCWLFGRNNVLVGVETDGYIHT